MSKVAPHPSVDLVEKNGSIVHFPTSTESIQENIIHHLMSFQGRDPERSGASDTYKALAYTLRDVMVEKWMCC